MFEIHEDSWYSVNDDLKFQDFFEFETIRTNKQITYYNDVLAFDIEASSFDEDIEADTYADEEIYKYLLSIKIKITQRQFTDIPDFNLIRRSLFGRLYFSKSEGISIDSLYRDLNSHFSWCFPDDIINPSDQLEQIIQVFNDNRPDKEEPDTKRSMMYVWGLAINGRCIIGRTWEEFVQLLDQISENFNLSKEKRMIIYVHSLGYEFNFIKDLFTWEKVFAISTRKPIYALSTTGIEFRCSYLLSNLSLENVGKSLTKYKVHKLTGNLDYDLVRHNKTPLSQKEIRYQVNDTLVVSAYIKEAMEKEGNDITKLPLTATGYCRRYVRNMCLSGKGKEGQKQQFKKYHEMIRHLTIANVDEYKQMRRAFQGGFTHCSCRHSTRTLFDVDSYDLTSAYPAAACMEGGFPMSKAEVIDITSMEQFNHYIDFYCCIFDVRFYNLTPKYTNENYISVSKCFEIENPVTNNGRLVGADMIATTITEIDYNIIKKMYNWDSMEIGTFRAYKRGYLPKEIILSILQLYNDKTKLKGVKGQEDFYIKGKQLLNSIYGMMVTSIIMPVHTYGPNGWTIEEKDAEKELKKYNNSKKRFLFFAWGIYITAFVRKTILETVLAFGDDYAYTDTDSIKAINAEKHQAYIDEYNKKVEHKLRLTAEYYNIPFEMFKPKTIKGEEKLLGVFDKETENGKWLAFRSLGAKRYMYLEHDRTLVMTVSGVNKKHALPYIIKKYGKYGAFSKFNNDLVIPAEYTGKLTHYYLDEPMEGYVTDYLGNTVKYSSLSGIYMEKASYSFSMEAAYLSYLREYQEKQHEILQPY